MASDPEKAEYDSFGNNPDNWLDDAACLLGCGKLLVQYSVLFGKAIKTPFPMPERYLISGAVLLRAFAVECSLKALFLKRGGVLAKDGKYVGPTHHHLATLASRAGFSPDPAESELLGRLTLWSERGRYPIERHADKYKDQPIPTWTEGDEKTLAQLFRSIGNELGLAGPDE